MKKVLCQMLNGLLLLFIVIAIAVVAVAAEVILVSSGKQITSHKKNDNI